MKPPNIITRKPEEGRSLVETTKGIDHIRDRLLIEKLFKEDTDTSWIGQPGGCEGLRQKGWTSIVVATLELNRIQTGIESMQVGQGDNVIKVAKIPKKYPSMKDDKYIREFRDDIIFSCQSYLKNLKDISAGIWMVIKLEETWYSTVLLNYGKELFFDGAYMSGVLKKIGRMFQDVSDAYPSLSNRVSSQCTTMHSATLKGFEPVVPYFVSILEISLLLIREYKFSLNLGSCVKKEMDIEGQDG